MKRLHAPQNQTAQERALWLLTHKATKLPQTFEGTHCMLWKGAFADTTKYSPVLIWQKHKYNFLHFYLENVEGKVKPNGMEICHNCNTRGCANPLHVRYGTRADNIRDYYYQVPPPNAKLTQQQAEEIRQRYKDEAVTQTALAKEYGVSNSTICQIVNFKAWEV